MYGERLTSSDIEAGHFDVMADKVASSWKRRKELSCTLLQSKCIFPTSPCSLHSHVKRRLSSRILVEQVNIPFSLNQCFTAFISKGST